MRSKPNIPAIILAAGASKRMGFPKALLEVGKGTLLEDQISRLKKAGCKLIIVVIAPSPPVTTPSAGRLPSKGGIVIYSVNRLSCLGQFSSIKCGLKSLKNIGDGCIILPVDCPFVPVSIIKKIIKYASEKYAAVIPKHGKKKGHPVWISRRTIQKILKTDTKKGRLDAMLKGNLKYITTKSSAILNNINTKKQWLQLLPRHKSPS